ncbi:hypothetical protein J2Y45_002234 [Dyadobacter sp. BE34]|uniref:Anti-sigma factor n=1 Tax=Dyadobacter fermentans TaxID=94254 RepID=A0ABU1QWT7_9BACT|nr:MULTISPECIES: hypothetical protein [Dyadobacter]MDR6805457.1 hypothetical protein [Dyadobacter fermentans]MDR7042783.1 hypothetical protein [Dyadobacter sp. BE242]MDR7197095.1 hypothetical protein [Dyadobacter sp. BE34]MDR7215470.1 hypothetical protein [Dyadobacter sp. BE31]MDR7263006.1 hypothetical protein [Dyadobacter sp. BE32]
MEKNHINLQNAIRRFPAYEPGDEVWNAINENLLAQPLRQALSEMPSYEPDDKLWDLIDRKNTQQQRWKWGYAAAMLLMAAGIAWLILPTSSAGIAYSQETVDQRLQMDAELKTDQQYRLLKTYCETETLVCKSTEYQSLQQEYERLSSASEQLVQAIGDYNTEPALLRQYNEIERQKTDILNAMAKMI